MKRLYLSFFVISIDTLDKTYYHLLFSLVIFTLLIIAGALCRYTEVPITLAWTSTTAPTQTFTKLLFWWIAKFLRKNFTEIFYC